MSADLDGDFGGTFPFEARYLDLGDISIHYVDEGPRDGAPILMLHGNPTWSYMYRRPIRSLSERGHRAIAFDHMGFGRSSKQIGRASCRERVEIAERAVASR